MSIEDDFHATLAAHAPLTTLVGTRIAQNAVPPDPAVPLVVFSATHQLERGLDGAILVDACQLQVQCWAETAIAADAVADAVAAACATAPAAAGCTVVDRASTFDPELMFDGTVLTIEWWGP